MLRGTRNIRLFTRSHCTRWPHVAFSTACPKYESGMSKNTAVRSAKQPSAVILPQALQPAPGTATDRYAPSRRGHVPSGSLVQPQPTRRTDIWVYLRHLPPRFLLIICHSPSCSLLPAAPPFLPLRSTPSCNAPPGPLPLKFTTSPVQAQVAPSERTSASTLR